MEPRCQGTTRGGRPCSARPQAGRPWCPWHDPDRAGEYREWAAKGGRNRSNHARGLKAIGDAMTLADVQAHLSEALRGVFAGTVEPGVATAMANLARAMVTVGGAADLEEQIAEMRSQIVELAQRRPA